MGCCVNVTSMRLQQQPVTQAEVYARLLHLHKVLAEFILVGLASVWQSCAVERPGTYSALRAGLWCLCMLLFVHFAHVERPGIVTSACF
jgi:hypothetical protein